MNWNFPNSYTPWYQPQQQQTNISVAFIQGGDFAASNYLVAPNQAVILIDDEAKMMYMKTTDASGHVISSRKFKEEEQQSVKRMPGDYITREEFEKAIEELKNVSTDERE